jgi:eukaryotic-like serine/threonine-protein kinase
MRAIAIAVLAIAAPVCGLANDSAGFRGDSGHPGIYETKPLLTEGHVKWKFSTRGQVVSSPAVVKNVLYVGSADHRLYAIDIKTGEKKWEFKTKSGVASSPAVVDGLVYFSSYDGNVYAVEAESGKQRWKFETGGERRYAATHLNGSQPAKETMPDPFDVYLSSPVVWKGAVYLGSGDGNIYSLDAAIGTVNWKFKTGDVVHATPAIADGTLYVGSWDSYFYALDAATGKETWRFKTGEDPDIHNQVGIQSSAVVADGIVYFGCRDSNLYAVDAATGKQKWLYNNKGSWVIASALVSRGTLYFATSDSGMFHAVDAKTGAEQFSLEFGGWPTFSSPSLAGDVLYFGSLSGKLIAVDAKQKKILWEFQTDGNRKNGAELTKPDGTPKYEAAFLGDFYDDMVAGLQKMKSVGAIYSSPVPVDGVLYFGSTDGNVYALE